MTPKSSLPALAFVAALTWPGDGIAEPRRRALLSPPVSPACISSPFGPRVLPELPMAGPYHYGVDLPAPAGKSVHATAPGTVIGIQHKGPGGLEMLVQHDGFVGIYSHFGMIAPPFANGKLTVTAGEKLGVVGTTGITSGAHLYFAMLMGGKPVDPAPHLGVPHCDGTGRRTHTEGLNVDEINLPTRKYYLLLPVSQPFRQSMGRSRMRRLPR
jgi:murein DD-endopeptidase MepM/ murein hydrolase activator NlpD